jgi:3-hydroxymyristoyl/3-hydroxydecanoyl-(acyl carrier protein) dehydratase/1-acyl-sn-glycerol-3-phosphate acyltransferase
MPEYLVEKPDPRPLAKIGDFPLDYRSLIHCAWGKPSRAFGKGFSRYDGTGRSPRLPGPPYHFMTRITDLQGDMAAMKPGAKVTAVYDLDAWFFTENASPTMPNAVLMEIALQPCGWLASYTLNRKEGDAELLFRNLDGEAVQHREIVPTDRSITTEVELLSVSKVGDLIIEKFAVRCSIENEEVLRVETVFGFFPPAAMENQKGFPTKPEDRARLELPSETRIDLKTYPPMFFGGPAKLPASKLLMLDRISGYWPQGGKLGLGALRAEKDVNAKEWFFKAHFFQDPVQPGSLGIEAMLQAMQSFMLLEGMSDGVSDARFEPIDIGGKTVWHYRGQVTPLRERITTEFEVIERGSDARGAFIIADAKLWVDGLQIYHAPRIGMRILRGPKQGPPKPTPAANILAKVGLPWHLDHAQAQDKWILDHCPTYTLPSLPLTYELEMMAQAAAPYFKNAALQAIETADAKQWVAFPSPAVSGLTLVDVESESQANVTLQSKSTADKLVTAATARLRFGPSLPKADLPALAPLQDAAPVENPYAAGTLFHGPSFQLMRDLVRGSNGATAILDAKSRGVPVGLLHPGLLDAALHCIPHDDYRLWCSQIVGDLAAYPIRIENFTLFGALDSTGDVEVHARFVALESGRFPRTHLRLVRDGRVLAAFDLVEILLPKGRLGAAPAAERRAFLRDRRFVPGIALSDAGSETTKLKRQDVLRSDWLPGTLAAVYGVDQPGTDLARHIAIADHVGQVLRLHPGDVAVNTADGSCRNLPLNRFAIEVASEGDVVSVRSLHQPAPLNWERIHKNFLGRMAGEASFVVDLGVALMRRFVRRVVVADPDGYADLRGKPVLYLANHQTGIESFLALSIIASLSETPIGAIAKQEHRLSWIGTIHRLAELAMGELNPLRMLFFNRSDQGDMLRILGEFGERIVANPCSLLVHVDGTRAQMAGAPVRGISSVLIDLAVKHDMPIVPVRFAGGLPIEPVDEKLEFPIAYGQQDYYLGRAIPAQSLGKMPYAQRARFVADRINNLGPLGVADVPLPSDEAYQRAVAATHARGHSEVQAVLRAALNEFPACGSETLKLVESAPDSSSNIATRLAYELIGSE